MQVDEHEGQLATALTEYLTPAEQEQVMRGNNKPTQILALQSRHLVDLLKAGWIEDFRHMELEKVLSELLSHQGAAERIKNFPYPRQYATMNLWFVKIFVWLVPFGMLQEFEKLGGPLVDLVAGKFEVCYDNIQYSSQRNGSMLPVADDPKEVPGGDTEIDVYPYQLNAGAGTHRCM